MQLLPADYVVCAITLVMAVTGLFRGFSGTLAFAAASVAAGAFASFSWQYSATISQIMWIRAGGVLVCTLLVFGLVRLIVRKFVNGLLAQPADALFGFLIGVSLGAVFLAVWAYSGFYIEHSNLAQYVAPLIK